jgi:hypothetical protein
VNRLYPRRSTEVERLGDLIAALSCALRHHQLRVADRTEFEVERAEANGRLHYLRFWGVV